MNLHTLIEWTSSFLFKGLLGTNFHYDPNLDSIFCNQTAETLIRRRRMRRLI